MIIKGVFFDRKNGTAKIIDFNHEGLESWYKLLDCDLIDIVSRKFGDHYYDIVCDDEGLMKANNLPSIYTTYNDNLVETIVGNVFVCKHDGLGGEISLSDDECNEILKTIVSPYSFVLDKKIEIGVSTL